MIMRPAEVGWRLGRAQEPRGGDLWVPWDRTAGVIGPQGSGKTLDLLTPALLGAPGAALVTLTKVDDLLLSFGVRSSGERRRSRLARSRVQSRLGTGTMPHASMRRRRRRSSRRSFTLPL
jgi:hypothetical protein